MHRLADVIDGHRWDELLGLLAPDFSCRYIHTGEEFDREAWVQVNADYPGFQNFVLEDCVSSGERAVGRAYVTGLNDGELERFGVATFITVRNGLIVDLTEVWTDINAGSPSDRRPQ